MRGFAAIVAGPPGIGKTSFALEAPKPLSCLSIYETGYDEFEFLGAVPQGCQNLNITDYASLTIFIEKSNQKTLVIDGLRGFQQIYFAHLTKTHFDNSSAKFNAYYTGPRRIAVDQIINFFNLLNLKIQKGTNVILLCHTKVEKVSNEAGEDYLRAELDIDEGISESIKAWIPNILYMSGEATVSGGKAATSAPARLIYTSFALQHCAKNKMNLPRFLSMGTSPKEAFTNLWSALPAGYKQ